MTTYAEVLTASLEVPPPTFRQLEVLALIEAGRAKNAHPPTIKEIAASLCVTSTHTVACHLEPLRRRGLLTWVPRKARTLAVTEAGKRLLLQAQRDASRGAA